MLQFLEELWRSFFPSQPRREGNRLYKTSNYLSVSFRKTCNTALWQKAFFLFLYSMGYCAVPLQLLAILQKCCLGGAGFAFDNWHLLLETDKGVNSLSLGKGDIGEKNTSQAAVRHWKMKDELIFSLGIVRSCRLWHNSPVLLPPKVRREQLQRLLWQPSSHHLQ